MVMTQVIPRSLRELKHVSALKLNVKKGDPFSLLTPYKDTNKNKTFSKLTHHLNFFVFNMISDYPANKLRIPV